MSSEAKDRKRERRRAYKQRIGKSVLHRAERYKLSIAEVIKIAAVPVCQACGCALETSHAQKFDHCHTQGSFRGVLCALCNMACSGYAEEAVARLRGCISYLERCLERSSEQV